MAELIMRMPLERLRGTLIHSGKAKMSRKIITIMVSDGVDLTRAVCNVAQCLNSDRLLKDGTGKQRKSLYHVVYKAGEKDQMYVKNFYRVNRKGEEEFYSECLNPEESARMMELKRQADEIVRRHKTEAAG